MEEDEAGEATEEAVLAYQDRLTAAGYREQIPVHRVGSWFWIDLPVPDVDTRLVRTRAELEGLLDEYAQGWRAE